MTERNPDTLPTPGDPSGRCPWCNHTAHFGNEGTFVLQSHTSTDAQHPVRVTDVGATLLRCQGCRIGTLVVTDRAGNGLHWYPAPGAGQLDPSVNPRVASCFDEGARCLGIGAHRAAAVMLRSALTAFVKDKGDEKAQAERHLKTALKHMKNGGQLHPSLWDWADHLNQLGNEGAHPEDYDDVTEEEAVALSNFVKQLIHIEYEMPAQLLRARGLEVPE